MARHSYRILAPLLPKKAHVSFGKVAVVERLRAYLGTYPGTRAVHPVQVMRISRALYSTWLDIAFHDIAYDKT